ncbi:MAG: hypothetical protein ABIQ04_01210 [Candidatus Saccharimonadales bacterium]
MIVFLHVLIALSSIILTTYAFFRPSRKLLNASYAFIGLTLASGIYMVVQSPSHMLEACSIGVFYLVVVASGTVAVRAKLSKLDHSNVTSN